MTLAIHADHLGRQADPVRWSNEEQHGGVGAIRIDLHLNLFTRRVFSTIRNQFQIVEAVGRTVEPFTDHSKDVAALHRMSLFIFDGRRKTILPRRGCLELLNRFAVGIALNGPDLDGRFSRLAILVISDFEESYLAWPLDGHTSEGLSFDVRLDHVTDAVITSVNPSKDSKRLTTDQDLALTHNRAS